MTGEGWRSEAKCRPYRDWPWIADEVDPMLGEIMVEVCLTCPVVVDCRAYTAELEARGISLVGVWGGEVKAARQRIGAGV